MQRKETPLWVGFQMKNGQTLFLSSAEAVPYLCRQYKIDVGNIADMRSIYEEMMLDGKRDLKKFMDILEGIQDLNESIIIHCQMGLNRTPVSAAILLVEKMNYHPSEAKSVVEKAIRIRKPDYELNEKQLYSLPLQEVEKRYYVRNAPHFHQQRRRTREVDEINRQKQLWYSCQ